MKMTAAQRFWAKTEKANKAAAKREDAKRLADLKAYQSAKTGKTVVGQVICKL